MGAAFCHRFAYCDEYDYGGSCDESSHNLQSAVSKPVCGTWCSREGRRFQSSAARPPEYVRNVAQHYRNDGCGRPEVIPPPVVNNLFHLRFSMNLQSLSVVGNIPLNCEPTYDIIARISCRFPITAAAFSTAYCVGNFFYLRAYADLEKDVSTARYSNPVAALKVVGMVGSLVTCCAACYGMMK